MLASEYYNVAGESAKAEAARAKQQQLAMQKMQPAMDEALRQAEELQKHFAADPAQVAAMREQAEAARKSLLQQQQEANKRNKRSADELEKELGL